MRWILSFSLGIGPVACVPNVQDRSLQPKYPAFAAQVEKASQALGLQPLTNLDEAHLATWDGASPIVPRMRCRCAAAPAPNAVPNHRAWRGFLVCNGLGRTGRCASLVC